MTNYASGVRIERALVNLFRGYGWDACRTAGSHGLFDVIAVCGEEFSLSNTILEEDGWEIMRNTSPHTFFPLVYGKITPKGRKLLLFCARGRLNGKEILLIQAKTRKKAKKVPKKAPHSTISVQDHTLREEIHA